MDVKQIRLANLRALIDREGAVSQLALRLQISPIYIYRVLDGKFTVGDSMARKIEDAYQYQAGWMDVLQNKKQNFEKLENKTITSVTLTDGIPSVPKVNQQQITVSASITPSEDLVTHLLIILENEIFSQGQALSETEKARLLMKAAERILDKQSVAQAEPVNLSTVRRIS